MTCLQVSGDSKKIGYVYTRVLTYNKLFSLQPLHQNFPHKPPSEHPWPRNVFLDILIFVSKICCCIFLFALFIISWSLSKSIIQESSQTQPKVFTLILRQTQPSSQAWHKLIHSNTINQISDIFLPKNNKKTRQRNETMWKGMWWDKIIR